MKKYLENMGKICRKYEVCKKYVEVQDGPELCPLYSLWDLEKLRALPPPI